MDGSYRDEPPRTSAASAYRSPDEWRTFAGSPRKSGGSVSPVVTLPAGHWSPDAFRSTHALSYTPVAYTGAPASPPRDPSTATFASCEQSPVSYCSQERSRIHHNTHSTGRCNAERSRAGNGVIPGGVFGSPRRRDGPDGYGAWVGGSDGVAAASPTRGLASSSPAANAFGGASRRTYAVLERDRIARGADHHTGVYMTTAESAYAAEPLRSFQYRH